MVLRESVLEDVRWIHVQDREGWRGLLKTAKNLRDPYKVGNFLSSRAYC